MASLTTKLDTRRSNKNGNYPVQLVISNNQTNAYIYLSIDLPEKAWIKNGLERPVRSSHPGAMIFNDQIQTLYLEFRKKISDLELCGWCKLVKAIDIKERILHERSVTQPSEVFFIDYADKYADSCQANRTKDGYKYLIKKLIEFEENREIRFEDITFKFLRDFDNYLSKTGLSLNTRAIYFRYLRAVYNRAIDDDVIKPETYPFKKFKIKNQEKDKESLTPEQVKMLYEYEFERIRKPKDGETLKHGQNINIPVEALEMARDYWMLSFFLCGINPVDLFNMKKTNNGHISFERTKTMHKNHNIVRLQIQPEAQAIIDKYKSNDDSEYLLKFIDKYLSYDIFRCFLGKKIRDIAILTGIDGLTMYWARYSWATIADSIDIQEKTISKGLGHADTSLAGKKYISFDWSKVDKANRQVIDFVFEKTKRMKTKKG